jgi:hypothetical protein
MAQATDDQYLKRTEEYNAYQAWRAAEAIRDTAREDMNDAYALEPAAQRAYDNANWELGNANSRSEYEEWITVYD